MTEIGNDSGGEIQIERGFSFDTVVAEELPSTPDQVVATQANDERTRDARAQELESVDFYIAQGYADIALDTLDLLERQFGPHADIDSRRRQLQIADGNAPAPAAADATVSMDAGSLVKPKEEFEFSSMGSAVPTEVAAPILKISSPVPQEVVPHGIDAGLAEIQAHPLFRTAFRVARRGAQ